MSLKVYYVLIINQNIMQKIIFHLLFFISLSVFGQNGEITGTILDKKTNESIPYANLIVMDGDKIESGGVTNEKGKFIIDTYKTNLYYEKNTI